MNIGIIGLGLIGGSLALASKKYTLGSRCYGRDINPTHVEQALTLGIIDEELTDAKLPQMDIVILAVPVDIACELVLTLLDNLNDNALVMDVGSTKAGICERVSVHPKRNQFLATHPIAGTEFSGPSAAYPELFLEQTQILCETSFTRPDLLEWALQWFRSMSMRIKEMDPKAHDQHIAYVSHLSHVSSFMLGKTVMEKEKDERAIFDMAGSGFASTVRLAKSSPSMWTPIFKQNRENLLEVLTEYIENLSAFKNDLEQQHFDQLYQTMEATNAIRSILAGINENNTKNNN